MQGGAALVTEMGPKAVPVLDLFSERRLRVRMVCGVVRARMVTRCRRVQKLVPNCRLELCVSAESDDGLLRRTYRNMSGNASHQVRSTRESVLHVCGVVVVADSAVSYRFLDGLCVLCTANFIRMDS